MWKITSQLSSDREKLEISQEIHQKLKLLNKIDKDNGSGDYYIWTCLIKNSIYS